MLFHLGLRRASLGKAGALQSFLLNTLTGTHAILGPPVVPFYQLFPGEGSPTKIDYRKKGTLFPSSLLEDLVYFHFVQEPVFLIFPCWFCKESITSGRRSFFFLRT